MRRRFERSRKRGLEPRVASLEPAGLPLTDLRMVPSLGLEPRKS